MEISVDICFINKYNRYLVNRVERENYEIDVRFVRWFLRDGFGRFFGNQRYDYY